MQQDLATPESDAPSLMPTIVFAALASGPLTAWLLWPYGAALALLLAPLGASVAGSLAALLIYLVRRGGETEGLPVPVVGGPPSEALT